MENQVIVKHQNLISFPLEIHPADHGDIDIDVIISFQRSMSQSSSYTSLKDLLPPSPPSTASPTTTSWKEIPIKDPLVQHAAWAYLQPIPTAEVRHSHQYYCCIWWRRMLGCFNDVVLVMLKNWLMLGGQHHPPF